AKAIEALDGAKAKIGFDQVRYDDQIGKLSVVGAGMRSHPGVTATLFEALSDAQVNIDMISTSEIRISVVTRADLLDDAVRAAHAA
ncbi:ACT domain-containing protein, partial [Mycobacterium tuberculosis]|nr:ACT domain-containing protein [Mycobacterium tuberculosis]